MRMHTFGAMNTELLLAIEEFPPVPFGMLNQDSTRGAGTRLPFAAPDGQSLRPGGRGQSSLLDLAYPANAVTALFREVEALVHTYERQFTRFSEASELSALNRAAGGWFAASPELLEVVALALEMYHATGGLFNPAILPSLEAAGYDRSLDQILKNDSHPAHAGQGQAVPRAFRHAVGRADFGHVQINRRLEAIRLPEGMRIDLGGIAKGWIGQRAAERLARASGAALVDAGGDLYAVGLPAGAPAWTVAVEDPLAPQRNAAVMAVGPGAVATSTTVRRRWKQAGQQRHHLIDPATGAPAESLWISVTAVLPASQSGNEGARAEALAKAMLIAGPIRAAGLLESYPGACFIAIDQNGKVWESVRAPLKQMA